MRIEEALLRCTERDASDLHMRVGLSPRVRVKGRLETLTAFGIPDAFSLEKCLFELLDGRQVQQLIDHRSLDFSFRDHERTHWRCHYYYENSGVAAAFRRLANKIPTLEELNLPPQLESLIHHRSGLVLITGATGSGKSSTLAALIGLINRRFARHIITIEDPIEFVFENRQSVVQQRAVGRHVPSFKQGVLDCLVQNPDVIVIGELRDFESVRLALTAAGTGTLVFATLHSNDSAQAIDRLVDAFPAEKQSLALTLIAQSLLAVTSQMLLNDAQQQGRVPAMEILLRTAATAQLIRVGKCHELSTVIQTGGSRGMQSFDSALKSLLKTGRITKREARAHAKNPAHFDTI